MASISLNNSPVSSASRAVGTTTRVADATKAVAPVRSSPPKKGPKSSKPSSSKQQDLPVHESETYFTIKTNKGKSKESSPVTSVHISPIKFNNYILKRGRLKRSYKASEFFYMRLRSHPVVLKEKLQGQKD